MVKSLPAMIPGSGRSPREGNGSPLQYSCLENPLDRGAWWDVVHGVSKESDATERLNNKLLVAIICGVCSSLTAEEAAVLSGGMSGD